jgi:hypothetical protein
MRAIARRSELKASVNNALLGCTGAPLCHQVVEPSEYGASDCAIN